MQKAQEHQKHWYDRAARKRVLQPGQKVLLLLPTSDTGLLAKWQSPYEVHKKTGDTTYELYLPDRKKKFQNFHINVLRPWNEPDTKSSEQLWIRAVEEDEEAVEQHFPTSGAYSILPDVTHLSAQQRDELQQVIPPRLFSEEPGRTTVTQHSIRITKDEPIRQTTCRVSAWLVPELKKETNKRSDGEEAEEVGGALLQLTWVSVTTSAMVRYLDPTEVAQEEQDEHCQSPTAVNVYDQTIRNRPHEGGLRTRRRVRLAFATEHQNWQIRHRRLVLFTDESRFYLSTCDRCDRLWRRRGECYAVCNIIQHDWFGGGSVMVWGGTDLYRLDNGTLTAIRYQDQILRPLVRPYAGAVGLGFLPVHNNARPHVARVCRQFLENE
ncbi:hypothetical protein NFI96_008963 [Prochilodus magdalenae]|nr:hypothetical protein NFI96_008963 [Prochilodus magdalenae]